MSNKTAAVAEAPAPEASEGKGSGLSMKLKIAGIIAALMAVELVAVVLVLPRSAAPAGSAEHATDGHDGEHAGEAPADASDAGAHGAASKEAKGHGKKDEHGTSAAPVKSGTASEEIDLGEFTVTSYQPASNTTLFISFHLFGTLLHKNSDDLARRLDDNKHRVRDNIIVIIRSAEITDLTDAGLGLIKRRILETTNKTLGKPLLQAVVFSEFSFVEQ